MIKDHVKCSNCNTELYVNVGEEKCNECGFIGSLTWINPDKPEVEVD